MNEQLKNKITTELVQPATVKHLKDLFGIDETLDYMYWLRYNIDDINLAGYCFENFSTLGLIEDMSGLYFMRETNWQNYLKKTDEFLR
jgi:hypothetical protein